MNQGGSSLGNREQEPNVGLDSNCSILESQHPRMGLSSSLTPIPYCARGEGSGHTAREWLAGAGTQVSCFPVQCSSLRHPSADAQGSLMWPRIWEDPHWVCLWTHLKGLMWWQLAWKNLKAKASDNFIQFMKHVCPVKWKSYKEEDCKMPPF